MFILVQVSFQLEPQDLDFGTISTLKTISQDLVDPILVKIFMVMVNHFNSFQAGVKDTPKILATLIMEDIELYSIQVKPLKGIQIH